MTIRAVSWLEGRTGVGDRHDGASTRRSAMLAALGRRRSLETLELRHRGGVASSLRQAARLVPFLEGSRPGDRLLLFYPDFPLFHPPGRRKLPLLRLVLWRLGAAGRRGVPVVVDAVDLPRWQSPYLGYSLRLPAGELRRAEADMVAVSERWILPSRSLATLLEEDLGLTPGYCRILANGLDLPGLPSPLAGVEGSPAFCYVGDCRRGGGRPLEWLIDGFRSHATTEARLHLAGEGGEWLADAAGGDPRLRWWGHLPESGALGLVAACDLALVPYPEEGYFRWCHPSKLGLYLAAGTPVLATRLDETARVIDEVGVGEVRSWDEFPTFFRDGLAVMGRLPRDLIRSRLARRPAWGDAVVAAVED